MDEMKKWFKSKERKIDLATVITVVGIGALCFSFGRNFQAHKTGEGLWYAAANGGTEISLKDGTTWIVSVTKK